MVRNLLPSVADKDLIGSLRNSQKRKMKKIKKKKMKMERNAKPASKNVSTRKFQNSSHVLSNPFRTG